VWGEQGDRDTQDYQIKEIEVDKFKSRDFIVPTDGCPMVQADNLRRGVCHHWEGRGDIWEEWTGF
jgi:hypothetical protein